VCSEDSFPLLSSLGVDELFDYRDPDIMAQIRGRFDLVLDGSGQPSLPYLPAVRKGGSYVTLTPPLLKTLDEGGLACGAVQSVAKLAQQNLTSLRDGSATVKWGFFTPSPWALNDLALKLGEGRLRAHVGRVVPFEGALGAYRDLGRGKTVLSML